MQMRRFETADEVFEALGIEAIMTLTGGKYAAVHYYKTSGRFPPKTYVVLKAVLAALRADAPDTLWQMTELDPRALKRVVDVVSAREVQAQS
jgi:hypothetical protein